MASRLRPATVAVIKATAPVVAQHAREITNEFYSTLFVKYPVTKAFFNMANQVQGRQPQALANAIIAYASNIENTSSLTGALDLIAFKHCGLQVLPAHYQIVHDNLMAAIGKVLGDAVTPEIGSAWSEAVMELAGVLIDIEENMYKMAESRQGGFRGWKNFRIAKITQMAHNVKTFRFVPVEGSQDGFHFTPGQFLTVNVTVDPNNAISPRHYTVTSQPGDAFLEITVKRLDGGVVSGYLHDEAVEGSTVAISPPFGGFSLSKQTVEGGKVVLFSAGIGMTPMKEFLDAAGANTVLTAVHVDKTKENVPFHNHFEEQLGDRCQFLYSADGHRPNATQIAADTVKSCSDEVDGKNIDYYICGPPLFMKDVAVGLRKSGVSADQIHWEAFGPQLSCPM